jgi:CBS domain-containing protein
MTDTLATQPTVAARMTHLPISVPVTASFHTIATTLSTNRIGAVPVIDEHGLLVGAVSELDLIQAGLRTQRDPAEPTARELMTAPPVTVCSDVPLPTAARLLADAGIHRLFVVENGRLVGVVSRRDLLRGYVRDDELIREEAERAVGAALPDGAVVRAAVEDGVVILVGRVQWRSSLAGIEPLVRAVPGAVEVRNRIAFVWDDCGGRRRR